MPEPNDDQIRAAWDKHLTKVGVANELGLTRWTAGKRIDALGLATKGDVRGSAARKRERDWELPEAPEDEVAEELMRYLRRQKRDASVTLLEVANALDCSPQRIERAAEAARASGFAVTFGDAAVKLERTPDLRPHVFEHDFYGRHFKIGLFSCTHFGSIYSADAERRQFYDLCVKEGVEHLYHCGDVTSGNSVYRGHLRDLRSGCIDADAQAKLAVEDFTSAGLPISFILGNHDDKWLRDFGFNVGETIANAAAGSKHPIKYLGSGGARVILGKKTNSPCVLDLLHPGGGTAYALSYRLQKIVESYTGGDKPHIVAVGHFHKAEEIPHLRNMMAIQPGCFEWQTPFMRSRAIEAHVAGCVVEGWMGKAAGKMGLTRTRVEFVKFYAPKREAAG